MTQKEAIEHTLNLAKKALENDIRPNPFVGAVVLDHEGNLIGEGFHPKLGGPHAEVYAIEQALQKTSDLSQATIYISLEPCSHFGKTPPCADLIIQHKFKKVVIASLDPNPKVASVEKLKAHGIEVEVVNDPAASLLNARFFTNQLKNRPHYILKLASTVDGKIADYAKNCQWISNAASRQFVHDHLRANVDAILTSYKTVIQDKASLTIRNIAGAIQETNVIVIDKNLELLEKQNESLPIFYPRTFTKIIFITANAPSFQLPENMDYVIGTFDENGLLFASVSAKLLELGYYKILTEAGSQLNSSMIQQAVADELYWFIAPAILNDLNALPMLGLDVFRVLDKKVQLSLIETKVIEDDVLLHYCFN
ncbi:MAG: bifunctional diaminohydroxyphosphoribosylaminopyrimidine deaminase/5-amino-6-(5-phosphoribosylamino)uracil reductase RibD [Chitinophagia bacterium]